MPFAKGVSAKSHDFDADGNEAEIDYVKMMKIVLDAGYHGYVGIEWEGEKPSEVEGDQADQAAAGAGPRQAWRRLSRSCRRRPIAFCGVGTLVPRPLLFALPTRESASTIAASCDQLDTSHNGKKRAA